MVPDRWPLTIWDGIYITYNVLIEATVLQYMAHPWGYCSRPTRGYIFAPSLSSCICWSHAHDMQIHKLSVINIMTLLIGQMSRCLYVVGVNAGVKNARPLHCVVSNVDLLRTYCDWCSGKSRRTHYYSACRWRICRYISWIIVSRVRRVCNCSWLVRRNRILLRLQLIWRDKIISKPSIV